MSGEVVDESFVELPGPTVVEVPLRNKIGPCDLGATCTAKEQELSDEYRCRYCNKQLHGFISGCSQAKNENDFRDGVICKVQPCGPSSSPAAGGTTTSRGQSSKSDGVAIAAAAGLPEFLWETQKGKRRRDPNAPKLKRQRYTKDQKAAILETLIGNTNAKLPEVAKQFNIPEGTLRGWYDEDRRNKSAASGVDDMGELGDHILDPRVEDDAMEESESPPKKKRRQRYSNETKIQVILALETRPNASLNDVSKEFNVAPGTVRGWREEADKIQTQAMENRRVGAKANPSRDPLRRVWNAILTLFEKNSRLPQSQRLDVNVAVVKTIGAQARNALLEAHEKEPFLTETEVSAMKKFKASETWSRKWARDHQVMTSKPESGTQIEVAHAKLTALQTVINEYPPERVYTMTSASLFYRILPHRTYVSKLPDGKRIRACKGLKCKDRLTLYLCTNETGTDKIPITCIGKYEHPACFQVAAQKVLPYLANKQALSDAGTFQRWWRAIFLPHIRSQLQENEKCLLLVENAGPFKAELLRDPTGQVQVEALPASQSSTMNIPSPPPPESLSMLTQPNTANTLPQCQPLEYGIIETIKRRYRYRLLQEVMDAFDEREMRRKVANRANFPVGSRGLREGNLASLADTMRLLDSIWGEVAATTIAKAWNRTKLRQRSKDDAALPAGQRAKSEKRQTTREKKQLVKDLAWFLGKHEARDFTKDDGANQLEEMVEKLKNCFLYTDGEVIDNKEMMESLEEWIGLEDSQGMLALYMEEIKNEMNIEYLTGLKEVVESTVPEADEGEDAQIEPSLDTSKDGPTDLDVETAMELAATIKSTATKLFGHGDILGELAVRLDEASDSIFHLLRKQKEAAHAKKEAEKAKDIAKAKAKARASLPLTADSTPVDPMSVSATDVGGDLVNVLPDIDMAGV